MKQLLQNILQAGVYPDLPEADKKRLLLLNNIFLIIMVIVPLTAVIDILNGYYVTLIIYALFLLIGIISQVLVRRRRYAFAKYSVFFMFLLSGIAFALLIGNLNALYVLTPLAMIPLMVFRSKRVALVLLFVLVVSFPAVYFLSKHIEPFLKLDAVTMAFYTVVGASIVAFTSYALISYSRSVNEFYEQIIVSKNNEISAMYKDITDSITYAKRIQQAKLPRKEDIKAVLPESFVLFKPKDIVSGDFYFFQQREQIFLAAADCTGHGVPGAFMSMIGSEKLEDALRATSDVSEILAHVNRGIKNSLKQSESSQSTRDGMDIALCSIDKKKREVFFAGANRPLWVVRKDKTDIEEIKPTKKALGGFSADEQVFESHKVALNEGDTIYLFTDGYADTFGGEKRKKLTSKKFREFLLSIQSKRMSEQEKCLDDFIEQWKSGTEQVDDILVIGVRF